jgi:glutamate dehydrogenase
MFREFGANCKVVGIADGFGVAEDPNGLNSQELLRLVTASVPITSFNRSLLSAAGILMDNSTNEGLARRNSMPFRVKADAFVPAGGRPNTINGANWSQFLDASGKPSSKLIVEGANIFNTPEARTNLFKKAGVVIVKDSSANKVDLVYTFFKMRCD